MKAIIRKMNAIPTVLLTLYIGLTTAILGAIGHLVYGMGIEFGLGTLFGMAIYQLAHRARYGDWFA